MGMVARPADGAWGNESYGPYLEHTRTVTLKVDKSTGAGEMETTGEEEKWPSPKTRYVGAFEGANNSEYRVRAIGGVLKIAIKRVGLDVTVTATYILFHGVFQLYKLNSDGSMKAPFHICGRFWRKNR